MRAAVGWQALFPSGSLHSVSVNCEERSEERSRELNQSRPVQVKESKLSCPIFLINGPL